MRYFPFPDKTTLKEELARDLLYRKILPKDYEPMTQKAWETGVKAAKLILTEYGNYKKVEEIAIESGLGVERIGIDQTSGDIRYFSEYYSGKNKIILYLESIRKWAMANNVAVEDAEELMLAHEYFHFLECTKLGLTSRQYIVPMIQYKSIKIGKSGIKALSEIGAYGFSRTIYESRMNT